MQHPRFYANLILPLGNQTEISSEYFLKSTWEALYKEYFPNNNNLSQFNVQWSKRRQKRTLASCNCQKKRISVAKEILHKDYQWVLYPLLYHEMCHAVLYDDMKIKGRRRSLHGREFKMLEKKHPLTASLYLWIKKGEWAKAIRRSRTREHWQRIRKTISSYR